MNRSIIRYLLGQVLKIEAMLLLLPCIMAVVYQEKEGFAYLITAGVCGSWVVLSQSANQRIQFFI